MDTPLTKSELIDVMNTYIAPLYHFVGGVCAVIVIVAAIILVIKPFIRHI